MHNINIFYGVFYSTDGKAPTIGGIQTYIQTLSRFFSGLGYHVNIFQKGDTDFHVKEDYADIWGVHLAKREKAYVVTEKLIEKSRHIVEGKSINILATDHIIPKIKVENSIVIQHGISWDIPREDGASLLRGFLGKVKNSFHRIFSLKYVDNIVCVDYNYLNWYRALTGHPTVYPYVIPNFTTIVDPIQKQEGSPVKIIFARRFYTYRGTRLFCDVACRLLTEYGDKLDFTLAGEGPDRQWMQDRMYGYPNVHFITYKSEESLEIHRDKHIAVVPTIGSEGTSLSLLEAMSSQCAVVCTNVGGMTNMVLDHYNGLMVNPDEGELYQALKTLVDDVSLRNEIRLRGYETVKTAFSLDLWQKRWFDLIRKVESDM